DPAHGAIDTSFPPQARCRISKVWRGASQESNRASLREHRVDGVHPAGVSVGQSLFDCLVFRLAAAKSIPARGVAFAGGRCCSWGGGDSARSGLAEVVDTVPPTTGSLHSIMSTPLITVLLPVY